MNYLDSSLIEFYKTQSGFTAVKYNNTDYGRVAILKLFPFKFETEYLSVRKETDKRTEKAEEIGILRSIKDLKQSQKQIIEEELSRRYFMPEVISVIQAKEEYGHSSWSVETTAGKREFTVKDMNSSLLHLGNNKVIITDVCGNRFLFNDITKMGDQAMKIAEIWL